MRHALAVLLSLLIAPVAFAQGVPSSPIVKAQLHVHAPSVKAGKPVAAGVTFTMPPEWHIYGQNPGDSGIPTTLSWKLPEGLSAGEIAWPAPERIEMGGLVNYGYSNVVTLPVTLTPAQDDVVGEVAVKASWLVCKDICIPESADLTAMLNADAEGAKVIEAARAKVPQAFQGRAVFDVAADGVTLVVTRDNPWGLFDGVRFSPIEDGIMANNPAPSVKTVGNELTLTFPRGTADVINDWRGVLHLKVKGEETAWALRAKNNVPVAVAETEAPVAAPEEMKSPTVPVVESRLPVLTALVLAFLGGLILNIMPCVLPILALKALALSKKAEASRAVAARQGLSYTAGVVVSFLVIAGGMLALKATGSAIGWGFQLQNVGFVAFLILVMLLVSANLLGMFELPVLFGARATEVDDTTAGGSFFTGVLAVLVATPCTAPFMATAIGATLSMPTVLALAVFAALGLGMASPFLLISFWPAARRLLPKPGAWMVRFKQILAIPMLATAVWLAFVLTQLMYPAKVPENGMYTAYSAVRLNELRAAGKPVLVDVTAAWCISCKVNERVAFKSDEMQQFLREKNVTMMVADWTSSDPEITEYLAGFGRNGVPLYVYYPPRGEPKILPQILTPTIVREAIEQVPAAQE